MLQLFTLSVILFLILGTIVGANVVESWDDSFDPTLPLPVHTHELHALPNRRERRMLLGPELTPLYQGYGTHFSYIYVGTPPQRQSVIVDTGSHYTAFPCSGCQQCGKHTDAYFDMKKSSTATTVKCGSRSCSIHQSYAEGSSWNAVLVEDNLWVGGLTEDLVDRGPNYTIRFKFGCQSSETGLFRTQLADGIMGMSMSEDVLPSQLYAQKLTESRIFSLCFRVGGGIMTIGGVNQRIHKKGGLMSAGKPSVLPLTYAKLQHPPGSSWYTVKLLDVMLQPQDGSAAPASIGASVNQLNTGKGVIVDSGTTDTYLPASLKTRFVSAFDKLSGVHYTESDIRLSASQLAKMPNIVFSLEGVDGSPFQVMMPWTSYVDNVGSGKYAFRVYLTEGSGGVLGANFMTGYNVVFDRDNGRVGFASSTCIFEDFAKEDVQDNELGVLNNTITGVDPENSSDGCESTFVPTSMCSARCDPFHDPPIHVAEGVQTGVNSCRQSKTGEENSLPNRKCHELCDLNTVAVGVSPECVVSKWSDCAANCSQWRINYSPPTRYTRKLFRDSPHMQTHWNGGNVSRTLDMTSKCGSPYIESRVCNAGACPLQGEKGSDYLVYIDMKINIPAVLWGYAYTNAFEETLAELFMLPVGVIDILTGTGSHDLASFVKVRFEIRLRAAYYDNDLKKVVKAAEAIPAAVFLDDFRQRFLQGLVQTSKRIDHIDYDRYGMLRPEDISIINSMAVPLGGVDAKAILGSLGTIAGTNIVKTERPKGYSKLEIFLIVLVSIVGIILALMLYFHIQLRKEHNSLYLEKMAYVAKYEPKLGDPRKAIGRMWKGVKDAIKNTTGQTNEEEKSLKKSNSKRSSSRSAQNSITSSIQSISSVVGSLTGSRHADPNNAHRNSYRYEKVPNQGDIEMNNGTHGRANDLVVAGDDEDDEAEGSQTSSEISEEEYPEFYDSRIQAGMQELKDLKVPKP